jgi:hypothetical protein
MHDNKGDGTFMEVYNDEVNGSISTSTVTR